MDLKKPKTLTIHAFGMSIMGFLGGWARNEGALFAIKRAMEAEPLLRVTIPTIVADNLLDFRK
jgi:hypothetical protein